MDKKKCSKCGEVLPLSAFGKCKSNKDGLQYVCKACRKVYRDANKERLNAEHREYYYSNKECILASQKIRYENNKEKILKQFAEYRAKNKEKKREADRRYREKNKQFLAKKHLEYYLKTRDARLAYVSDWYYKNKDKVNEYNVSNAKYENFKNGLTKEESPRLAKDGISLEVKCRYCGKYFIPTTLNVGNRIKSLTSLNDGDRYLYCSNNCKEACPVYNQTKFPKGFKKASSREVDPLVRQLTFERDNWECQVCGKSVGDVVLHCHHIDGYTQNPILGNDVENCITLCKLCHKQVHKLPGCNYFELRCKNNQ